MNIKNTIIEQNGHWRGKTSENLVEREVVQKIKLESGLVEVLTGVRRSGKSAIFEILINKIIAGKKGKKEEILLINFDHPSFLPVYRSVEQLDAVIEEAEEVVGGKIKFLFLDEIQNVEHWEKWVKAKYDAKAFKKIFITGSNSRLLEGEFIARLSGRYFGRLIQPFSFREYLVEEGIPVSPKYVDNFDRLPAIGSAFMRYLKTGGFPESVISGDIDILKTYYQTIILKDVIDSGNIRDSYNLKQCAYYLLSNCASLFSFNQIGKQLDIHENTVKEYVSLLEDAYLVSELRKFDFSIRKQQVNRRKIYCVDNGLVTQVGFAFSENSGRLLENAVKNELDRRGHESYYYAGKNECDFVLKEGVGISSAIQVCHELNEKNRQREIAGLLEAMGEYKLKNGIIITLKQDDVISQGAKKIRAIPAWQWFLGIDH